MSTAFKHVLFLGSPGVGKGTYARRAAPLLGFAHVSPGDLLRQQAVSDLQLNTYLSQGKLVPEELVFKTVAAELDRVRSKRNGVILDGFPRNFSQAFNWVQHSEHGAVPDLVIELKLPEHILVQKLLGRRVCSGCGDLYNIFEFTKGEYSMPAMTPQTPGVCDKCAGLLIQRSDDQIGVIMERLRSHDAAETELIGYLKSVTSNFVQFDIKTGIAQLQELIDLVQSRLEK